MFWDLNGKTCPDNIALIDTRYLKVISYRDLNKSVEQLASEISGTSKKLVFLFCDNSYKSITGYLSALRAGHAVFLSETKLDKALKQALVDSYVPEIIMDDPDKSEYKGYQLKTAGSAPFFSRTNESDFPPIHPLLGELLSTSGTTGSPKLVRLSYNNIQANAQSIASYLCISDNERPVTSLPMSYSYGLSVINSHLLKGATIVLTNSSFVLRDFWDIFRENRCTSFAGVPYSYQLLKKINFAKIGLPTLRTMTQAGGRLSEEFIKYFHNLSSEKKFDFYVMYGQTEATARISYVPKGMLVKKTGSIGIPIPDGIMKVYDGKNEISSTGTEGELVYFGPNVMLGYADSRCKLSLGDELHGELHTGDLAKKDSDGYFYITGRMKRFIKIFGLRLNLDDVEKMVENNFKCAAACFGYDEHLKILITPDNPDLAIKVNNFICGKYKIHHTSLTVQAAVSIPTTQFGKKDYKALEGSDYISR